MSVMLLSMLTTSFNSGHGEKRCGDGELWCSLSIFCNTVTFGSMKPTCPGARGKAKGKVWLTLEQGR